jgi:hypothetical protein
MRSALPHAEHLVEATHDLEGQLISILAIADLAIAELAAGDPAREDLLEIRRAAELAIAKAEKLVERAAWFPALCAS